MLPTGWTCTGAQPRPSSTTPSTTLPSPASTGHWPTIYRKVRENELGQGFFLQWGCVDYFACPSLPRAIYFAVCDNNMQFRCQKTEWIMLKFMFSEKWEIGGHGGLRHHHLHQPDGPEGRKRQGQKPVSDTAREDTCLCQLPATRQMRSCLHSLPAD